MQPIRDEEHYIAIADCQCGKENVPLSVSPIFSHPLSPNSDFSFYYCPSCDFVLDDDKRIKGYASEQEMKEMGWELWAEKTLSQKILWYIKHIWYKTKKIV